MSAAEDDNDDIVNGTATFTHTASNGGYVGVTADAHAPPRRTTSDGIVLSILERDGAGGQLDDVHGEAGLRQPGAERDGDDRQATGGDADLTVDTKPANTRAIRTR